MTNEELDKLDVLVALAEGWKHAGENDHVRPLHKPSLDFPGQMIDDFQSKGPHPRLEGPNGECIYLCGCQNNGELPRPTRDPAEAMRLLEKHSLCMFKSKHGFWSSGLMNETPDHGETPCIAICKAVVALHKSRAEGSTGSKA